MTMRFFGWKLLVIVDPKAARATRQMIPRKFDHREGAMLKMCPTANNKVQSGAVDPDDGFPGINDHSPSVAMFLAYV